MSDRHDTDDSSERAGFASSREYFEATVAFLETTETAGFEHGDLEERLETRARELFRRLFQDHPAPRGVLTYPPRSGEGKEVPSLGPMAYLDSKEEGDSSMPLSRLSCPGVWGEETVDPRDMAKA